MPRPKGVDEAIQAGLKALDEETASWMPQPKGWPQIGQRVRLLGSGPWGGETGTVVRFERIDGQKPEAEPLPVVRLDSAANVPDGQTATITLKDQWEAL